MKVVCCQRTFSLYITLYTGSNFLIAIAMTICYGSGSEMSKRVCTFRARENAACQTNHTIGHPVDENDGYI